MAALLPVVVAGLGRGVAGQVDVVRGVPWVTVRFEAPDDLVASTVGRSVVTRIDELVVVETSRVTRRFGARWLPLR